MQTFLFMFRQDMTMENFLEGIGCSVYLELFTENKVSQRNSNKFRTYVAFRPLATLLISNVAMAR